MYRGGRKYGGNISVKKARSGLWSPEQTRARSIREMPLWQSLKKAKLSFSRMSWYISLMWIEVLKTTYSIFSSRQEVCSLYSPFFNLIEEIILFSGTYIWLPGTYTDDPSGCHNAVCNDIKADVYRGWIRHSKVSYPCCNTRTCDVDENLWPNRQGCQDVSNNCTQLGFP